MSDDHEAHLRAHEELLRYAHENNLFATKEKRMTTGAQVRSKVLSVLTSVVTIVTVISQVAAELVDQFTAWDGEWINAVALLVAIPAIIRRVTPVAKEERGLT